jgi:hypothetical protein
MSPADIEQKLRSDIGTAGQRSGRIAAELIRIVDRFVFKVSPKIRTDATFDFCDSSHSKSNIM